MTGPQRGSSLEIAEDIDFQRKSWKVQRVGWVVMLSTAVLAVAGLFGGGPLSSAHVGDASSGLRVSYERFTRMDSPEVLDLEIGGARVRADSTVTVWLSRKWIETAELRNITPEPSAAVVTADRIEYQFRAAAGTGAPLHIRMYLETRVFGVRHASAGIVGGPSYEFTQLAYP